jgi:peroxiredoxin
VIAVLPAGAFDARRKEIEAKLGWNADSAARLEITEDQEAGWTSTFAVEKRPSTYLLTAGGELVHSQQGELDPDALSTALRKHLSGGAARPPTMRLRVDLGDRAPDVLFVDDRAERGALHRFRRRGVLVNFFQSWSAPCLTELARLQVLHDDENNAASVVAFHGGQDAKSLDELRKRLGLTFPLIHDAQHRVARRYGVRCWPTTITVGPDGAVEHIELGTSHQHAGPKDPAQKKLPGRRDEAHR